jgi:hypothetical protein
MSKKSLDILVTPKGGARPASLEPGKEKSHSLEASNHDSDQPSLQPRRRAWDGQDNWIKVNYEVPERIQTKLKELKNWKRIKSLKEFVAENLEWVIDREIAKAEKDGF